MLDIGAGTMDVLLYDDNSDFHYKAVVKSPVRHLAEKVEHLGGNLAISGVEMGGGMISTVLGQRAKAADVVMSESAAATIHHDLNKVKSLGIQIVKDDEIETFIQDRNFHTFTTGDLEVDRIRRIVEGFGIPFSVDVIGICAQDHGVPPAGVSHLDFRHRIFKEHLDSNPLPQALLFRSDEVPTSLNRLVSIAKSAEALPAREIYVMDSGMAAIIGASMDVQAVRKDKILVFDVATSHTLGAALENDEIFGFFEYHTRDISLDRLESLVCELADGNLSHERILQEGGHGAYIRDAFGFEAAEIIIATGPKRRIAENSNLPIVFGSPLGDNMMTGTVGMLEAIRRRKGLKPVTYL
jgi:uncharacterized protein (DUF1786 family)